MADMESYLASLGNILGGLISTPFDPEVRFAVLYLAATVLLAFLIWAWRREKTPFFRWLAPKSVYLHRSNLMDVKLFVINRVLAVSGVFGALLFSPLVAFLVLSGLSGTADLPDAGRAVSWQTSLLATVLIVVSADFCKYWAHRLMHEWPWLWPFHSVHHSAEVLTPLTLARAHPMDMVLRNFVISLVVGVVQGLMLFAFAREVGLLTIGGANAIYFFSNTLGANLRHSHIWLSFGPIVEHIIISPAQHQIHHSSDVRHHNKNYGSLLAVWDWMFGTLYVPPRREELTFGLADQQGKRIPQPHNRLADALIRPFAESWQAARNRQKD